MSKALDDLILQRLYAREASLVNHANALDQKASYLLVATTFLAAQLTNLLGKPGLAGWHWLLFTSGTFLAVATLLIVLGTLFKTMQDEGASGLEAWIRKTEANRYMEEEILAEMRRGSCDRLTINQQIFIRRSRRLELGGYFVVASLALNLVALAKAIA